MLNLTNAMRSRQHFEVYLERKQTTNAEQNARKRVEHVQANDRDEADRLALQMPRNAAYKVQSVREVR